MNSNIPCSNAFSFSKSGRSQIVDERNDSPSPGQYDGDRGLKIIKEASPEWQFSRSGRPGIKGEGPGPGQYEGDVNKLKQSVSYSIASPGKDYTPAKTSRKSEAPGPGQYEPVLLNKPPTYTMGQKRKDQKAQNVPGPGQYDLKSSRDYNSQSKIAASPFLSKTKRNHIASNSEILKSPGPGAYEPKDEIVKPKNPTYGMSKGQKGISRKDLSPGPGAYEGVSKEMGRDAPKATIKGRPSTAKVDTNPGPGAYDNNHRTITEASKSARGTSAMRNKSSRLSPGRENVYVPGPGAYQPTDHAVRDRTPTYGFGTTERSGIVGKDERNKPGPGNYDLKNQSSAKSFKIGSKLQQAIKNQVPGPGNYDPNPNIVKDSVRTAKIAKQMNQSVMAHSKSTNLIPGPGSYYQDEEFSKNAKSFQIRGKPQEDRPSNQPGPGAYDPKEFITKERVKSPNLRSGSKRNNDLYRTIDVPGPGQYYDQNEFGRDVKSFTIQGRSKERQDNQSPGPGAYEPADHLVKSAVQTYKQSTSKRADLVSREVKNKPGPGQYQANNKALGKDVPSYTMGKKNNKSMILKNPGPGAYDASQSLVKESTKAAKMTQSKRPDIAPKTAREIPGPGQYASPTKIGKDTPAYSMRTGRTEQKRDNIPGPGAYNETDQLMRDKSPSFRMGTGQRTDIVGKETTSPAPGQYDLRSSVGNGPRFTFQSRTELKVRDNTPGPGGYDSDNNAVKDRVISYKLSNSQRPDIVSREDRQKVGPGGYESPIRFGQDAQSVTIRGRPEDKVRNDIPGPGNYDVADKNNVISYKISQSQRPDIVSKEERKKIGPGEYESPIRIGKDAPAVSIRGRPEDKVRNDVPGPGNYEPGYQATKDKTITYQIGKDKRQEIVSKHQVANPAPGQYDQPTTIGKNTHTYTIKGRPKDQQTQKVPGPGAYEPKDHLVKETTVTYKMPSGNRGHLVSKDALTKPGPGQYDDHNNFGQDAKTFSIRGRPQDRAGNQIPGPGQYDQPDQDPTKDRTVAYKLGTSNRADIVGREATLSPAPGQYDSPRKQSGPSYTIGGRSQSPQRNDIPGPGQYNANDSPTRFQSPSIMIKDGTGRSNLVSNEKLPGPGQYDQPSTIGRGPAVSIRGRLDVEPKSNSIGPGAYEADVNAIKDRVKSAQFSKNKRELLSPSSDELRKPAPGQYDVKDQNHGPTFQIRGRPQEQNKNQIPGPGTYDQDDSMIRPKNRSISFSPDRQVSPRRDDSPGPGQYDMRDFIDPSKDSVIVYSIPKGEKKDPVPDTPGPGYYKIPVGFANTTAYSGIKSNQEFRYV